MIEVDSLLLDTNALTDWFDQRSPRHARLRSEIGKRSQDQVWVSPITRGEIEYGLALGKAQGRVDAAAILSSAKEFQLSPITEHVAETYGKLRARLFDLYAPRRGQNQKSVSELFDPTCDATLGIQENDLWLAAQAITYDFVFVSSDKLNRIAAAVEKCGEELKRLTW